MKKLLAFILSAVLLVSLLTGCGKSKIEEYSAETVSTAEETAEQVRQDSDPANYYLADAVVCTVDGLECTWEEYYYWLNNCRQSVESQCGEISDWDALNSYYTNMSNEQVVLTLAQNDMLYYHTILVQTEAAGITPTDEEAEQELLLEADQMFGDGDGELTETERAALDEYLAESGISYALQLKLARYKLAEQVLFEYYTADVDDEQVVEWATEKGYMSAKHILLLTVDATTREPLDDATVAEKAATADYLLAELTEAKTAEEKVIAAAPQTEETTEDTTEETDTTSGEATDPAAQARADFEAYFDKLMNEYSEDTGLASHPNGYVFLPGEMVEQFETAVQALDEDLGLSGVVESEFGYHIILRRELDPDVVLGKNRYGYDVTLRDYALNNIFSDANTAAAESATVTWTEGFDTIDLAQLFANLG